MHSGDRNRITLKHLPLSLISVDNDIVVGDEGGVVTRISVQGKVEAKVKIQFPAVSKSINRHSSL